MVKHRICVLPLLVAIAAAPAGAAELRVVPDDSVFAVVTHKAGFASGRAHNHFIAAHGYTARLAGEAGSVEGAAFDLEFAVADLVVDSLELATAWYPRLEALGILAEPFRELTEKDRAKIRDSMLGEKQLDAEQFPGIKACLVGLEEKPATLGSEELRYELTVSLEVHGKKATSPLAANLVWDDGTLHVEAAGVFRFTDFGIEPFSAFLGAVKNTDEFHVYVSLTAGPSTSDSR